MSSKVKVSEDSLKDDATIDVDIEDTKQLKIDLEKKRKLILELEMEKQYKESKLSGLQNLLDSKLEEYTTLEVSKKTEIEHETECKNKLKTARIKRMDSILEYKNNMAKLREQVFSPSDLDDSKINEEIEHLMAFYEELNEKNKMLQFEINRLTLRTVRETEANDVIDKMQLLIKQLKLETFYDRKSNEEMQIEIMLLEKKIREKIETN